MQTEMQPTTSDFRTVLAATRPFAKEEPRRTWLEVAPTLMLCLALQALLLSALSWAVKLPLSVLFGLVLVRLFVLVHDMSHGAIFRKSRVGRGLLKVFSLYLVYPPPVWRARHNQHHRHNSRTNSRGQVHGQVPMLTLREWRRQNLGHRITYRCIRHPLAIVAGYFTYFLFPAMDAIRQDLRQHWWGLCWIAVPFVATGIIAWWFGAVTALLAFVLPVMLAAAVGAYLFYAQHCFEGVEAREPQDWEYFHAALRTTSLFEMPALMHWFTANIGYHHVHHINVRIPFYRLPEAMAHVPALQDPPRTSWRWRDIRYNLTHHIWDDERRQLLTFAQAKRLLSA